MVAAPIASRLRPRIRRASISFRGKVLLAAAFSCGAVWVAAGLALAGLVAG